MFWLGTCWRGELQQHAVAAQRDDERLLPHAAALCVFGYGALEHARLLSWKGKREQRGVTITTISVTSLVATGLDWKPESSFIN